MKEADLIKIIKKFRVDLDTHFSTMEQMAKSREISIAITSTQNAKMWLGQVLKMLDEPNPYPDSRDARNDKIAKTADTTKNKDFTHFLILSHIKQVKIMRQRLTDVYTDMRERMYLYGGGIANTSLYPLMNKSWEYIVEANMWLGMELGRINNENSAE